MKEKTLHIIIGLILGLALFVAMGHAKTHPQKGTGLPGGTAKAQPKVVRHNSIVGILRKAGTGIGLGLDIGEYGLTKAVWVVQKADALWDEYVEGKTN